MKHLRRTYRLTLLALHLALGILITLVLAGAARDNPPSAQYQGLRRWFLGRVARLCGLRVSHRGTPLRQPALWVANHVSWLDIPVLGGSGLVGFLSKAEVRRWPVIGWLAARAGTLFIARGGANASTEASSSIARRLAAGHSVVLFPEGTTSNGHSVLRFHARLFAPALEHRLAIQPVALRYLDADGKPHPKVPYIDDQNLLDNLWNILGEPSIAVEVVFAQPLVEIDGMARKQVATTTHALIQQIVDPRGATDQAGPRA
ncbi:MAG: lysophospholipid acyltransferase family protein [Thiotrichales bacterium]